MSLLPYLCFLDHQNNMCICVYLCVALYTRVQLSTETRRGWQVPWDGSYRYFGNHPTWVLGTTLWISPGTAHAQLLKHFFNPSVLFFNVAKKVRQIFGPVECLASCWRGSSQRRKDQMLLRKSPLVLIRLNKSAFNSRILSRIIQINLVN